MIINGVLEATIAVEGVYSANLQSKAEAFDFHQDDSFLKQTDYD